MQCSFMTQSYSGGSARLIRGDLRDDERDGVNCSISVKAEALEAGLFEQSVQTDR